MQQKILLDNVYKDKNDPNSVRSDYGVNLNGDELY